MTLEWSLPVEVPELLLMDAMIKMYKHAFGRYWLPRCHKRAAAKPTQNTPKPQNRPSPKAEGSAKGSTNGDEAAVLKEGRPQG